MAMASTRRALLWAAAVCVGVTFPAAGKDIYFSGFEPFTFSAGTSLNGQDGWVGSNPFLNPDAAQVVAENASRGQQAVRVEGAGLNTSAVGAIPAQYVVGTFVRRPFDFDASAPALSYVMVQSAVRLDGLALGSGDFYSASFAATAPGSVTIGEMQISSDGNVYAFASGKSIGSTPVRSQPIALGYYHTLGIGIDFAHDQLQYFLDAVPLGGTLPFDQSIINDVLAAATISNAARADTGLLRRTDYTSYYDDVIAQAGPNLASVPMPGALAWGGVGAAGALVARRRFGRGES
jgi:hypothetical protein